MTHINPCPLCKSKQTAFYTHSTDRDYFICSNCQLIFVSNPYLLNEKEEKKRYDFHNNSIDDPRYVAFLSQLIKPLLKKLKPDSKGLDFGSGPQPVLSQLLRKEGFKMDVYDPFYADNPHVFTKKYDFITLSEVAEHLYTPAYEFKRLISLLKPNAYLALMTLRTDDVKEFKDWFYQNDDTHVCFFSNKSMDYIAKTYQLELELINDRVVIFYKAY